MSPVHGWTPVPVVPELPRNLSGSAHSAADLFSVRTLADELACRQAGRELAALMPDDCVLCLNGNLGAGKTTLVRGLAEGLGISATVKSPTYNYFLVYAQGQRQLVHLDAYRIGAEDAYHSLLVEEVLKSPWLLAVEWADQVLPWLPRPCWRYHLSDDSSGGRCLEWQGELV